MAIKFLNTVQVDTDVLFVDAASNRVGVGTRTPAKKFTVVEGGGEVRISTVSGDTPIIQMIHNPLPGDGNGISNIIFSSVNDATQSIGYASIKAYADDVTDGTEDGSIRFATMKAGAIDETLTLKSGNVGIGTTSPSTKLEISSSGVNGIDISQSASNATQSGRLFFSTNTASEGFALFNSNGTLQINSGGIPNNTSGTNRISIIGSSGNVGIGTTSPSTKLHVSGGDIRIDDTERIEFGAGGVRINNDAAGRMYQRAPLGFFWETTGGYRMVLNSSGNVGIGTTSPSSRLHIEDTAPILKIVSTENFNNSLIEMGNGALADAGKISCFNNPGISALELKFDNGSTGDAYSRVGQRYLEFGIDGNTAMYVNSSKNVGIGTTSPQSKLQVDGGVQLSNDTATASATKVGTFRYYADANNSYVDMCMQTDVATYAWVNIVTNNW